MDGLTCSESIVVVVAPRDRFSMFPRCLEALYTHTDVQFRVIVVAGGADRRTQEYLQQLQVQNDNLSVMLVDRLLMQGEARNLGIRQAAERFCVVLENDTIVHKNWLPPMLECMREEGAAAVMPLIWWYGRIHAAGCMFEERKKDGVVFFHHKINYTGIRRRRIDYPECHCVLIDRKLFPNTDIFEDVEPFDVDLGLTIRKYGLSVFLEPRSVATYSAPPPLEVRDIPLYKFRWNAALWEGRNRLFMQKWGVSYDPSSKLASYRRQHLKLGLARWYPTKFTVGLSNLGFNLVKRRKSLFMRRRSHEAAEGVPRLLFVDNQVDDFLKYRMELARKVQETGYEVHVALPREPGLDDLLHHGFTVHIIYLRRMSTWPLDELRCWLSLLRLYRWLRPTLVHHMCLKPVLYGGIAARVAGVPAVVSTLYGLGYVFSTHTLKTYILRAIVTFGLRFAFRGKNHRVVVQNSADRTWVYARLN